VKQDGPPVGIEEDLRLRRRRRMGRAAIAVLVRTAEEALEPHPGSSHDRARMDDLRVVAPA